MTKGHLLFINRVFPPDAGASGLRLMELCQGLAAQGWRITVLTNKGRNMVPGNLHPSIRVVRLPFGTVDRKPGAVKHLFWLFALYFRALFLARADITITMTDPPMSVLITALLKPFKRTKTVHWVHDLYPDLFPVMGVRLPVIQPLLQALSHWAMRRHDAVVAIGEDMQERIAPVLQQKTRLSVIPNWPDVSSTLIDKKKPPRHDSNNPFILEGVFTVLYSGNFGLIHDFNPIIDAIKIVHQSPHPIRFIFAGDGRKFTDIRDTIEQMQLSNVHFMRAQPKDKFMDMLLAGDLHLSTMVPEAKGMVAPSKINSALGLSRPCLYLGAPDTSQAKLIRQFNAGTVVDPRDPHARFLLAEAVITYATDHEAYARAQEQALQAAESISFDKGLAAFNVLFRSIVTAESPAA